jgi:hypothetical protein|tara:strand:- start:11 stop:907 length:897 start_codon:yes stop_codon:yes gene_type:complete
MVNKSRAEKIYATEKTKIKKTKIKKPSKVHGAENNVYLKPYKAGNIVEWCRDHDVWYLHIDLEIPEVFLTEAEKVYEEGFFVEHRTCDTLKFNNDEEVQAQVGRFHDPSSPRGGNGWYSSAIHGFVHEDADDTSMGWHHTMNPSGHGFTEENVKWGWTEAAEVAPETKRWLEEFPHKHYRRLRWMLLKPGHGIISHDDASEERKQEGRIRNIAGAINLAIHHPEKCYLRRSDTRQELPYKNFGALWFDNGTDHEVLNYSDENRYIMIMHGGFNKERKELMKKSLVKQFGKDVLKEIDV